jgi:hypothetical protein
MVSVEAKPRPFCCQGSQAFIGGHRFPPPLPALAVAIGEPAAVLESGQGPP